MTTGTKIQHLRKSRGMSQEELAAKLTVSRQAVSKWELDEALPDTENIIQLGEFFNVTTDYLLYEEVEDEQDLPIVQSTQKRVEKKNHIKLALLIAFLVVVVVLGIITRSIVLMMGALSLAVMVYVVYLLIVFLRRNTR